MDAEICKLTGQISGKIVDIRHDIHMHPETAYNEFRTAGLIEKFLDETGIPHKRYAGTGIAAFIGKTGKKTVALRSEMDALPTDDHSGKNYASVNKGVSHACGHDGHISILLGTAWVLKKIEDKLHGQVMFIWQPAEEGGAGAKKMLDDGVFKDVKPDAIFGLHGWPSLDVGKAAYRFGSAMAATDNFRITVKGKSAHGAMPHAGIDPITIAARIIEGIQLVRSRMINPLTPFVVTIGTINGGSAVNIIPDEVTMSGTIRTIDNDTRKEVPVLMERMIVETAKASGGDAVFEIIEGYPPVINETKTTEFARKAIADIIGKENLVELQNPVMGGEDFAYFLEQIPGTFLRLGVGDRPSLHNSGYDFNDEAIPYGIRIMAGIAYKYL